MVIKDDGCERALKYTHQLGYMHSLRRPVIVARVCQRWLGFLVTFICINGVALQSALANYVCAIVCIIIGLLFCKFL